MQVGEPSSTSSTSKDTVWIIIELKDEAGKPVADADYELTAPGQAPIRGKLDHNGFARIKGLEEHAYRVSFPKLKEGRWHSVGGSRRRS